MNVVEITPDEININEINPQTLTITEEFDNDNSILNKGAVNFGGGIELLMNEKKTEKGSKSNIEIDDITNLENELNDLADDLGDYIKIDNVPISIETNEVKDTKEVSYNQNSSANKKSLFEGLFGNKNDGSNIKQVKENDEDNLGKSTANMNENKTWDGYGKFNNVPINLESAQKPKELTKEEELKEKFKYLRKLEDLEKKGVSLSKRYTMESDLQEMMGEYETIIAEKEKSNAVKFQGKMLMACITGLEFLNNKFDPFDIKLDGWGEQINENIDDYDEIFSELHEKYKSKAKMSPELKLLFQLGGSAMMVHMSNTLFKSSMPGMDDIMRQNPELMKQFTQAAANTMGQTNPGFGGFMSGLFGNRDGGLGPQNMSSSAASSGLGFGATMPPNVNTGPPPSPMQTKLPERSQRPQNFTNRPDIAYARGVNVSSNEGDPFNEERITRPEMKGPTSSVGNSKNKDIESLLSGLKPKNIDINEVKNNESSTISVDDLKELSSVKLPTKSKRKQKSDKNIVSLDI